MSRHKYKSAHNCVCVLEGGVMEVSLLVLYIAHCFPDCSLHVHVLAVHD